MQKCISGLRGPAPQLQAVIDNFGVRLWNRLQADRDRLTARPPARQDGATYHRGGGGGAVRISKRDGEMDIS